MPVAADAPIDLAPVRQQIGAGVLLEDTLSGFPRVWVKREALMETLRLLRESPSFRMHQLTDLTVIDNLYLKPEADRFEVSYLLKNLERETRVAVRTMVPASDPTVPSATELWAAADWAEREAFDQYGVVFTGHWNLRRILNHKDFVGHPLRKDYDIYRGQWLAEADDLLEELELKRRRFPRPFDPDEPGETMLLNIGPSHPATHGTLRTLVELDGERILYAIPEIGYLHRGFEKSAETHEYNQVIPYTDRLNYCSAISNNVGYAKAVESLCGIEVPERCQYIRVILCELSRIMDHLVCNGANLVDLGALTNFWYLFNLREKIYKVIESVTGARLTNSYTRIGGLWSDVHDEFLAETRALLIEVPKHINDTLKLVARNRIFIDRTVGVGGFSVDDAISHGFTGPCLRATGFEYDLRKQAPYYVYDRFKFEVVTGFRGDTYDRTMVRFEEILQSVRIIEQALEQMPRGPVNADHPLALLPSKNQIHGNIEGLVNHFKVIMHGISPPAGEVYDWTESPNGELGFHIVSDGTMRPYKCRVRPPCFYLYSAFTKLVEGGLIADAIAVLGSLNIIAGELDR